MELNPGGQVACNAAAWAHLPQLQSPELRVRYQDRACLHASEVSFFPFSAQNGISRDTATELQDSKLEVSSLGVWSQLSH